MPLIEDGGVEHRFLDGRTSISSLPKGLDQGPKRTRCRTSTATLRWRLSTKNSLGLSSPDGEVGGESLAAACLSCSPPMPEATAGVRRMALRTRAEPKNRPQ